MSRAVRFDRVGPASVLYIADVEPAVPGPGKIRVRVKAAGLNPADYKVRNGDNPGLPKSFPASLGRELAGVVESLGEGVTRVKVGDEVFGNVAEVALAELAVTNPNNMAFKPAELSWEVAGCLALAGQTAWDELASQNVTAADTVLVSAAAGGVGTIVSQLALRTGATVIGTASEENHEYLRARGIIPVSYGDGLADRVRVAAPSAVTVVFDHHGSETILAALELGVSPERINTIAMDPEQHGVRRVGRGPINTDTLAALADLVVTGELDVEIAATYPLDEIVEAYERLEHGHVRGKIVVLP
jgi:enoyl reductase